MTLKERYLEENIIKTIDRAINQEDYQKLKDELQLYRGQARLLAPEIERMQEQYNSVKNSPQGPALKLALDAKTQELQKATDTLDMYKDKGRHALGTEVKDYQLNKAKDQGLLQGAGVGGLAGLAGGLAVGQSAFGEASETFAGRVLEEAGYDMNNLNTGTGTGKKQDFSKPAPYKNYSKPGINLKGIHTDPNKITSKIDNYFRNKGSKVNNYFKKANQRRDWIGDVSRVGNAAPSAIANAIVSSVKSTNNFRKSPGAYSMINPGKAAGVAAGALGLGAMGLSHLFGDGDIPEGVEGAPEGTDETIPEGPPPVSPSMFDKFPGGKLGAGAAGLGAAGLAGLAYDRNRRR